MRQSYRTIIGGLAIALGLGASASAITPQERLQDLREQGIVAQGVNDANHPTQLTCTVSQYNVPMCEGIIQGRTSTGDVDPAFPERRLETYLLSPNPWGCGINPRDPTQARHVQIAFATNTLTRDTATSTSQPYVRINLTANSGTIAVNSLLESVTGSSPITYGTLNKDLVCPNTQSGLRTLDENVQLAIKSSLRGVFRRNGVACDVAWASVARDGDAYRIELSPQTPCADISTPGTLVLALSDVNQSGTPMHGTITNGTGTTLNTLIDAQVCFADRKSPGQAHDANDYQCFDPDAQTPMPLDMCRLNSDTTCDEYLFADGFETGDTSKWNTTQ